MKRLAISLLAIIFATSAHAMLIVAEPDDFALGTDLTNAFGGITLSIEGSPVNIVLSRSGLFTDGPSAGMSIASTGSLVFGHDLSSPGVDFLRVWSANLGSTLRIDFDNPTDYIAIDVIGDDEMCSSCWPTTYTTRCWIPSVRV